MTGRPSAAQRGYDARWRRAREAHLRANPMCTEPGCLRPACHVHHGTRHRGDGAKFWDRSTWRGLCAEHHNRDAQQRETRGYSNRLGSDGLPVDPNHPFNQDREGGRVESRSAGERGPHGDPSAELVLDLSFPRGAC